MEGVDDLLERPRGDGEADVEVAGAGNPGYEVVVVTANEGVVGIGGSGAGGC